MLRISIDGPTGSGKTTLGTELANHFDAIFFDTGLTYRALAFLLALGELPDDDSWRPAVRHLPLFGTRPEQILLGGYDITHQLRGRAVEAGLQMIARNPARREQIRIYHQQILASEPRVIVAGRDVAVTLLKSAALHVFLMADFAVRQERRRLQYAENAARPFAIDAINERDSLTLEVCRQLDNCMILDTTHLSPHSVLDQVISKTLDTLSIQVRSDQACSRTNQHAYHRS